MKSVMQRRTNKCEENLQVVAPALAIKKHVEVIGGERTVRHKRTKWPADGLPH